MSDESLLPGLQMTVFSLFSHKEKNRLRGSMAPDFLPEAAPPNPIRLGVRISTEESGRETFSV